jgi:hypothetical protein
MEANLMFLGLLGWIYHATLWALIKTCPLANYNYKSEVMRDCLSWQSWARNQK